MNNKVRFSGKVEEQPKFYYKKGEKNYYVTKVSAARLSGKLDTIKVVIKEEYLPLCNVGGRIFIIGKFRSYSKNGRLELYIYAKNVEQTDHTEDKNIIILDGYLCKTPIYRETPLGRQITDILLAVNEENYVHADYIPCICWFKTAEEVSRLKVGDHIKLYGNIQSREYQKTKDDGTIETRTAYEISGFKIIPLP